MRNSRCLRRALCFAAGLLIFLVLSSGLRTAGARSSSETTNITIVVKEADTGEPISQALITLQFTEPGGAGRLGKSKKLAYSAKTDAQGRCKLTDINKGTIVLSVTASHHQSYGKELQLDKDNEVFEVRLKKPQPLI